MSLQKVTGYPKKIIVNLIKKLESRNGPAVLAIGTAISLAISFGSVALFSSGVSLTSNIALAVIAFGIYILSLAIPIFCVGIFLYVCFQPRKKREQLVVLLFAYLTTILSFAGFYYSVSFIEDHDDCVHRYHYYEMERANGRFTKGEKLAHIESRRAFSGIRERFWQLGEHNETEAEEVHDMHVLIESDFDDIIIQSSGSKIPIFAHCVHFSALSMTMFGYGEVVPLDWKIKLANSIQILLGTLLLVVLFGMLFSDWRKASDDLVA